MKRTLLPPLTISACLILVLCTSAMGQGVVDAQRTRDALSSFPESQAVLFINLQKIVNTALPRFLPPTELKRLHSEPQKLGFDVKGLEYAVVGVRLPNPPRPDGLPEFVVLVRGTFNADSLLALGRIGLDAQGISATSQQYGSKTIDLIDLKFLDKKPESGTEEPPPTTVPTGMPYKEIAATALDRNTLVVGSPAYVYSAIDASSSSQGRLGIGMVNLASRDNNSLFSLTAELPESLPEYLKKAGAPSNKQFEEILGWLKQVSISSGMNALDVTLSAAIQTDAPEHASAISGMVQMGLSAVEEAVLKESKKKRSTNLQETRVALAALKSFTNSLDGNTVVLGVSVPQRTIAAVIRKNIPQPSSKSKAATSTRRRTRTRT